MGLVTRVGSGPEHLVPYAEDVVSLTQSADASGASCMRVPLGGAADGSRETGANSTDGRGRGARAGPAHLGSPGGGGDKRPGTARPLVLSSVSWGRGGKALECVGGKWVHIAGGGDGGRVIGGGGKTWCTPEGDVPWASMASCSPMGVSFLGCCRGARGPTVANGHAARVAGRCLGARGRVAAGATASEW